MPTSAKAPTAKVVSRDTFAPRYDAIHHQRDRGGQRESRRLEQEGQKGDPRHQLPAGTRGCEQKAARSAHAVAGGRASLQQHEHARKLFEEARHLEPDPATQRIDDTHRFVGTHFSSTTKWPTE
jgi:hypothetical protein